MSKHTPRPWTLVLAPTRFDYYHRVLSKDGSCIARIHTPMHHGLSEKDEPWCIADARLIAAAPELLKAAKFALNVLLVVGRNSNTFCVQELTKAIAKAEGEE